MKTKTDTKQDQKVRHEMLEIIALGKAHGFETEAEKAIEDGQGVGRFRSFVLEELGKKGPNPIENFTPDLISSIPHYQRSDTPLCDGIISQIPGVNSKNGSNALEVSQEISRSLGVKPKGIFVPVKQQRALTVAGTAGNLVETDLQAGGFIDVLRASTMAVQMGATVLNDLVGDVAIPRKISGAAGTWLAEGGSVAASDQSFDQVTLSPKTVGARTEISRQSVLQSAVSIEQIVRNDLAAALGQAIDIAVMNGSGSSNQPKGILNTSGIGAVVGGANGAAPTWGNMVDLQSTIAMDNVLTGRFGYLTNSKAIGKLMQTEKASGTAKYIIEEMPGDDSMTKISGVRCGVSNNVPSNLTKGTSSGVCSAIIYGNWADLLIGMWSQAIDIVVDPYTDADKGQLNITVFLSADIALRHAESFAAMQDCLT